MFQEWSLESPNGHKIQLTFDSFDTEASHDFVEVSCGSSSQGFSGDSIPGPFVCSNTTMIVRFRTDGSGVRSGFSAVWSEVL